MEKVCGSFFVTVEPQGHKVFFTYHTSKDKPTLMPAYKDGTGNEWNPKAQEEARWKLSKSAISVDNSPEDMKNNSWGTLDDIEQIRGDDGDPAVVYQLISSPSTLTADANGNPDTKEFTVELHKIVGNGFPELCADYYFGLSNLYKDKTGAKSWLMTASSSRKITTSGQAIGYEIEIRDRPTSIGKKITSLTVPCIWAGKDGEDGKDGVTYELKSSLFAIPCDAKGIPKLTTVTVEVYKFVPGSDPVLCADFYLKREILYSAGTKTTYTSGKASSVTFTPSKSSNVVGYNVYISDASVNGNIYAQITIPTIFDGMVGPAGEKGPLFYPAGEWSSSKSYTRTADLCPFVLYSGLYYFPREEGTIGSYGYAPNNANSKWQELEKIEYIFTKFLMANHALLAGAVAYDNRLFSQAGTLNGVETNTQYAQTNFVPHLDLNWKTGALTCKKADIKGKIEADSGTFKGTVEIASGKIQLNTDGSGKLANGNVNWDTNGNVTIVGALTQHFKKITINDAQTPTVNIKGLTDYTGVSTPFFHYEIIRNVSSYYSINHHYSGITRPLGLFLPSSFNEEYIGQKITVLCQWKPRSYLPGEFSFIYSDSNFLVSSIGGSPTFLGSAGVDPDYNCIDLGKNDSYGQMLIEFIGVETSLSNGNLGVAWLIRNYTEIRYCELFNKVTLSPILS